MAKRKTESHAPKRSARGRPNAAVTSDRRERVQAMWVEGLSIDQIRRRLCEEDTEKRGEEVEAWNRDTIANDLVEVRRRWAAERAPAEEKRAELEAMARAILHGALTRVKVRTVKRFDEEGKVRLVDVKVPDPDYREANRALERIASIHGLTTTKLEGGVHLGVGGLSELFAALDAGGASES